MLKMNKQMLGWTVAVLVIAGGLGWAFAPRPVQVEVATARQGRFEQAIEEDGRTRLKDHYTISAPVAARLARTTLREGDSVGAGDIVALLTPVMPSMVDDRSARETEARVKAAIAGIQRASARLERAKVAQEEARLELQRTEKLAREGFVSGARVDSARLNLAGALRETDAAGAEREVAVQERVRAEATLQPTAPGAVGPRPFAVRSPVAGVVLRVRAQSEATISPGTALLDIGDATQMEVVAELLTTDAVQAQPGARAVIERWGGPPVEGLVRRVEPAAFTKVSALGIEEQRVKVLIDVVNPPPAWQSLGDAWRVGVRIITKSAEPAQLVPVGALFPHEGGHAVYRLEDGKARLQRVQLLGRNADFGWVTDPLPPGQPLIVYPPASVADGKRVKVRTP